MVMKAFQTDALNGLCSKDQLDLLDSIDRLRSQGISHYVSLPQIIVCGDQSSGKSSVLEAISGVSFPIKSNLCTRFPTELILRKTPQNGVSVSIVPHRSRSESEQHSLSSFHEKLDGFEGLPALVENAKAAMGISTHGKAFSKDLLRVEVSGPDRPHLTIVDLPGLIHSETKHQSASDVELVQDVVQTYMKEPRSIILAVVSAKNDAANQIVLKLARTADKKGNRTLGVITKPDLLIPGSGTEASYVCLARNQDVEFRLGWHVLKNMDSEMGDWSLADRDAQEQQFFSQGIWEQVSQSLLGVDKLRSRLSKVLLGQIATELPSLIGEIEVKFNACRSRLDKLGEPRATLAEQRLYLVHISQSFQSLVKAAIDGTYNDPFFGDAKSDTGYQKRIRAVVQNLNLDFAEIIAKRGHYREITESKDTGHIHRGVLPITRDEFTKHIKSLMQRTRGRELPGTFNPMIVADLFLEQSTSWEAITQSHIDKVWKATKEFFSLIVAHVADVATSKTLFQKIFEPALDQLLDTLNAKTAELLTPHQKGHPITYNHYFTETYQKVRNERKRNEYSKVIKDFFRVTSLEESAYIQQPTDLQKLLDALTQRTEPDMNNFACSEALDCMEAYYKVALKRFIDDITIEAIESKLISPLGDIFSPLTVITMSDDLVTRIAGESEENRAQREQLTKQLDVLTKGSDTCEDETTQSDPEFKNGNTYDDDESSHPDGLSDVSFQEGVRSPVIGPPSFWHPSEGEVYDLPCEAAEDPVETYPASGNSPSKKSGKKKKRSAKQAVTEEM
ncbi:hypothetical protein GP486_001098 [Trichoglossum hirsutum]|uniref:Dynamin family protein n=1 Tax=Trichoglossum hirsutum TaxID=265104 RepID=A0A9P8LHT2_9PEZI|nr:hypothetical protein GP486_001098 [Trichoglossum hirsutum]